MTERERAEHWINTAKLLRIGKISKDQIDRKELSLKSIFMEENVSVRVAKITCYGVEKFLQDGNCKRLHAEAGYELISLDMLDGVPIVALKMQCPSTHQIYISPVPPYIQTVPQALDWYFNLENFLGRVGQQT